MVAEQQPPPRTFEEAVNRVLEMVDVHDHFLDLIDRGEATDTILAKSHHGLGTWLRNQWGLWVEDSASLREDIWNHLTPDQQQFYRRWWNGQHEGRTMHADDASDRVLAEVVERIRKRFHSSRI
jgi:hypothetical protein